VVAVAVVLVEMQILVVMHREVAVVMVEQVFYIL
jgi:hypothetical protein